MDTITMRITPEHILDLEPNQVFVFGSNLAGIHGAGAARTAMRWGAKWGKGVGFAGRTYALPTKDKTVRNSLPVEFIASFVDTFIKEATELNEDVFLVTAIGCGLAGYNARNIAPLFKQAVDVPNIWLPASFWEILNAA